MKYFDDHRVILEDEDITNFVSDVTLDDAMDALAVEVSFGVFVSPWDKYVKKLNISPGDNVKIVNNGNELFQGKVVTVGLDGQVTAYDQGRYLNRSEIILQCSSIKADDAIRQLCAKAGVKAGTVPEIQTVIDGLWVGDTAATILDEILETCTAKTGKQYRYRVNSGKLCVEELARDPITAYHKPAGNIAAFNITWALGQVSGEDSAEGLYNTVTIAAEKDGNVYVGAAASNEASKLKHGALQHIETVNSDPGEAELGSMALKLLEQYDRVSHTRRIEEIWGADEVRSGVVLSFNSPAFGILGLHRVIHVVHHYGGAGHTMELELQALEEPRASQDAAWIKGEKSLPPVEDNLKVYGLPDSFGGDAELGSDNASDKGKASKPGDAKSFVAVAKGEIGYTETKAKGAGGRLRSNMTKYGEWAGNNGVAWDTQFVCWCADQAGAPIPTNYFSASAMANYFKTRDLYKKVSSGYTPKPGDLAVRGKTLAIVESATRASIQTIEGNHSNRVSSVTRYYSEISGFCTPWG